MNDDTTTRFIASLVKSLQSLCHGYVEFEKNIEIIGHIYLNIDSQQKYDYVVNEQVCKNEDESQAMFVSNSFHAQPARTTVRTSRQCNALDLKIQSAKDTIGIDLSTFQTDVGQGRSASRESSQSLSAGSETGSVSGNVPNREPGTSPSLHCQNPERSVSRRKRHLHDLSSKPSPDVSPPSRSRDGERRDHHDSPSLRSQYTLGASASKLARRISNELEKQGLATPAQTDNDVEIHTRLSGSNETPSRFGRNGQGASQRQFSDDSSKHIDSIKDPPEKSEGQLLADSIDLSRVKEEVIEDESLFDQLDWNRAARDADQETYDPQAEGHEASEDQIVAENLAAAASSSLYPVMIHQNTAGLPMPGYGSPVFPQNFNEPTHTMSASSSPIASTSGQLSPGAVFGARRTQPGNSGRDALEMASQHELNPNLLRCNLCSYATSFVGALKRHLRTWHINKSPPIPPRPGYPWPSTCGMDNVGRFQSMVLPVTHLQGSGEPDVMITSDNTAGNPGMLEAISIFESKENEGDSSSIRGQHPDSLIRDFKCLLPDTEERDPCIEAVCSEDVQNTVMVMSTDDSENSPKVLLLCRFCNKSFRSRLGLKLHIDSKHLGKFQYKCKICGKGFTNLWNYRNHLSTHSLTPSEKCENCGAVFQFKISLQEHQQTCLPRTSAPTELVEVKEEASARMYSCHMCGRLFKWRSSLKYHRDKGCIVKRFSQGMQ
ncbi:uncharacterized protein [Haliotis cracherodii]|uniref:uncharacterized protein isoform X2 n=1 Tax=Haliotis cracherodii TaxID=6455 RepID=UPI0039EC0796